jgi:hypothetical protein
MLPAQLSISIQCIIIIIVSSEASAWHTLGHVMHLREQPRHRLTFPLVLFIKFLFFFQAMHCMLCDVNFTAAFHVPEQNSCPNRNFTPSPEFVAVGRGAEINTTDRSQRQHKMIVVPKPGWQAASRPKSSTAAALCVFRPTIKRAVHVTYRGFLDVRHCLAPG